MSQLAASFKVLRDRDASPTIRGFVYQVDITLERWLWLQPGQALVLECGEDIDVLGREASPQRLLEQIKHREKQRLTLTSDEARSALANAYEHFTANAHLDLLFRYTTNCQVGRERSLPENAPAGIVLWNQVREGALDGRLLEEALERLRALMRGGELPGDETRRAFDRFLAEATREQLLFFILRVEWSTEAPPAVDMRGRLEGLIRERGGLSPPDASQRYERLFARVFSVLCNRGEKRLDPAEREALLTAPVPPEELLQTVQSLAKRFEALELSLKRKEPDLSILEPSQYITSPRLDGAVKQLEALLRTERVVGLRGRPGDGKSEAARQLAASQEGAYLLLPVREGVVPAELWNQHLHDTASAVLGGEASHEFSLALRQLLGAIEGKRRLLVIDNADVDPPVPIAALLPHQGSVRVVVVGPAEGPLPSVHLPPPGEADFLGIADLTRFDDEAHRLIRRIGQATSYCPLVAKMIGSLAASPAPHEDLTALLEELGRGDPADQIRVTLEKCWNSTAMGEKERRRVVFVAAMGEPEIPLSWLPPDLRHSSRAWGLLERSGVARREREGGGGELVVRVHRLVASYARQSQIDVSSPVLEVLSAWEAESGLLDDLKANSARSRAFVSGFQYLLARDGLAAAGRERQARLSTFYVDLAPARALRPQAIEQHLAPLLHGEAAIATLHPAVWGALVDVLTTYRLQRSPTLDTWLRRASSLLESWVREHPVPSDFDRSWSWMDVTAAYHHAKALGQSRQVDAREQAVALLKRIDAFCTGAPADAREPWFLRQVRARLQLASWSWYGDSESRVDLLEPVVARPEPVLPRYLRLAVIARLLKLSEAARERLGRARRDTLVAEGVDLCKKLGSRHPEGQANFLDAAVGELERSGGWERYEEVLVVATAVLMQLLPREGPEALDAGMAGTRIAYVLGRAGAVRDDARGAAAIDSALMLMERLLVRRDAWKLTRIATLLREAGYPQRAVSLLERMGTGAPLGSEDAFFTQLELARALRWAGRYEAALAHIEALLRGLEDRTDDGRKLRAARNEWARILARLGRWTEVRTVLQADTATHEAAGAEFFARQCREWEQAAARGVEVAQVLWEGELLAQRRRESTSPEEREARDRAVAHLHERAVQLVSESSPGR